MRHKLCDSIAVCLSAALPAWLPNYMSLIRLMMHVSKCENERMHVRTKQGGGQVYAVFTFFSVLTISSNKRQLKKRIYRVDKETIRC